MKASLWQAGLPAGRAAKAGSRGLQRQDNIKSPILPFGLSLRGRRERKGVGWGEGFQRRPRRKKRLKHQVLGSQIAPPEKSLFVSC